MRDPRAARRRARADGATWRSSTSPTGPLRPCPLAIQQRAEIGRALARDARVFLFDEPNSALTQEESNDLFRRMHGLAEAGRVVLLVSHRIAELARHADRVALILDGRCTTVLEGETLTQEDIAGGLVVGQATREAEEQTRGRDGATPRLRCASPAGPMSRASSREVDLEVRAGEIVAIVGVEGSGARELVRSMAGFEKATGTLDVGGDKGAAACRTPRASSRPTAPPACSATSPSARTWCPAWTTRSPPRGTLRPRRMSRIALQLRDQFRVKAASIHQPIRSLSGGNQQKVAIAAAIVKRPEVLVLEEPTRGVDLGSKSEIYRLMREYAGQGRAVVIFCTEVPEVFEAADVAYVVSDGKLSAPLDVIEFADVEALARAITRLERHAPDAAPTAAPAA